MILPGARYQEHGWERVKSLLTAAGCAALSLRDCTTFAQEDPEADCLMFVDSMAVSLVRAARSTDTEESANHMGDPPLSLALGLVMECSAFPRLFVRHSARIRALPAIGAKGREARARNLVGQYFSELRDEVDAREIGAATGQPWTANRLWVYRKVDETWHDLCQFFANPPSQETRPLAESILQRPLQIGVIPIQAARVKRRRSCAPEWIIRWSEVHRGWLHNTNRAEGWHARPDRIAAVLSELADGDELHAPGIPVDDDSKRFGGHDWLVDYWKVIDESVRHDPTDQEEVDAWLEKQVSWDPWSPEELARASEEEREIATDGDASPIDELTGATAAERDAGRDAPQSGDVVRPLDSEADRARELALGLPPGYVRMAHEAEDNASELYGALSSHCSIWIRMQLYRQLIGPADPSYPDGWRLPSTRSLPTQAQLAALEGVSVPAFTPRVKAALATLRASTLGGGRRQR